MSKNKPKDALWAATTALAFAGVGRAFAQAQVDWEVPTSAYSLRASGYYVTSRVRCAARFARIAKCSIYEASQVFDVNVGAVWNAWSRIYPTRLHPLSDRRQRPTCRACGESGHLAVNGKCSPSEQALRLLAEGATVREAADRIGITTQVVYAARDQRRKRAV